MVQIIGFTDYLSQYSDKADEKIDLTCNCLNTESSFMQYKASTIPLFEVNDL